MKRQVRLSIVHPVTVTVIVERDSADEEWQVVGIRSASVEVTARSFREHVDDSMLSEMDRLADKAKDIA